MAWKEGALPLRNRWNGCGMALAASPQSSAFFPLTFLTFALPLAKAFTLLASVKLFLTLCGMWLWLKELGVSARGSLFGAISFSLSMTMTPWLLFPHTSVLCLWPWAFLGIELLRREAGWRRGLWALVVIFTLWPLAGHPESAASAASFASLWLLARWAAGDLPNARRLFLRLVFAAALALGLSAFLLLPQVFAILASNRLVYGGAWWEPALSIVPHGAAWPHGLLTPLFPRSLGDGIHSPIIAGAGGSFPEMSLAYFGIVGWACALLLLRPGSKRNRTTWTLLVPLLFGIGTAVGLWPFAEIVALVPALKLMPPLRFFSWAALAGAGLAAFELDRLEKDLAAGSRGAAVYAAGAAALLALSALWTFIRFQDLHAAAGGLASQREALTIVLAALGILALLLTLAGVKRGRVGLALPLALLCAAELFYQGRRLYPSGPPAHLFPVTPSIAYLRSRPGTFRILGEGGMLFPNSNVFAELEEVRTHDPVERRDYVEFLDATAGYPTAAYFKHIRNPNAPALDFLNLRYLVGMPGRTAPGEKWKPVYSDRDATVFENGHSLPRVFAPRSVRTVVGASVRGRLPIRNAMTLFREVVPEFDNVPDWRETAYILRDREGSTLWPEGPQPDAVPIFEYRESTNAASFRARNSSRGRPVVLVASLVQDGGWSASDEKGTRLPTGLANGPFLAISLPPGEHSVRLRYLPPGFRTGGIVTLLTLAAVLALLLLPGKTRTSPGSL